MENWQCIVCGGTGVDNECVNCGASKYDSDLVAGVYDEEPKVEPDMLDWADPKRER